MQLAGKSPSWQQLAGLTVLLTLASPLAPKVRAEDRVDMTTTWYQENRQGSQGGLTVLHPQLNLGKDIGDHTSIDLGYSADVVSGATAAVYSVDATSSATKFSDTRHVGSVALAFQGPRSALSLASSVGSERDYLSIAVNVAASIDLPGRNTKLGLSYAHGFDEVCDYDNGMAPALERRALTGAQECKKSSGVFGKDSMGESVWRDLAIDTLQATWTQNLSPKMSSQVSLYGQVLRGFQSNPYRRVRVSGVEAQEAIPSIRARASLMARVNRYIPSARASAQLMIRAYSDTWGVNSATLGLSYQQYLGDYFILRVNGRVYQQAEATFFKDAFFYETEGSAGAYFTGDRELGAIRNVVTGAKLTYLKFNEGQQTGFFRDISLNLKADIYLLDELPADPIEDNREGIRRQFLNSGQVLDAFVLQLGALFRF